MDTCPICKRSCGKYPLFVKKGEAYISVCSGECGDKLHVWHILVDHAKEGGPQKVQPLHQYRPPGR